MLSHNVMSIDFDGQTLLPHRFVGNHRLQFGEGPFGLPRVCSALFRGRPSTTPPLDALANIGQVLQANQAPGMRLDQALTHDMIGVLLQPSLPSVRYL